MCSGTRRSRPACSVSSSERYCPSGPNEADGDGRTGSSMLARSGSRRSLTRVAAWRWPFALFLAAPLALLTVACRETARPAGSGLAGPGFRLGYDERGALRSDGGAELARIVQAADGATDVVVFS